MRLRCMSSWRGEAMSSRCSRAFDIVADPLCDVSLRVMTGGPRGRALSHSVTSNDTQNKARAQRWWVGSGISVWVLQNKVGLSK